MMRSFLFVPGDSVRKFERASEGAADALIIDLEDSVAPDRKPEARGMTRAILAQRPGRQKLFVRVNPLDTPWTLADLAEIMPARPDGIVLPKCRSAEHVAQVGHYLDAFETAAQAPVGATPILAIVTETADSLHLGSYRDCGPRLWGMMWGAEDLAASIGATENSRGGVYHSPYRLACDLCLTAAAAAGVVPVDTVYTHRSRIWRACGPSRRPRAATVLAQKP